MDLRHVETIFCLRANRQFSLFFVIIATHHRHFLTAIIMDGVVWWAASSKVQGHCTLVHDLFHKNSHWKPFHIFSCFFFIFLIQGLRRETPMPTASLHSCVLFVHLLSSWRPSTPRLVACHGCHGCQAQTHQGPQPHGTRTWYAMEAKKKARSARLAAKLTALRRSVRFFRHRDSTRLNEPRSPRI